MPRSTLAMAAVPARTPLEEAVFEVVLRQPIRVRQWERSCQSGSSCCSYSSLPLLCSWWCCPALIRPQKILQVHFRRWVHGDGVGRGEDPAAGEAAQCRAPQDRGAREQVCGWAAWRPPVLLHIWGNRHHGRVLRFPPILSISLPNRLILSMCCNCLTSYEQGKETPTHLWPLLFRIHLFFSCTTICNLTGYYLFPVI